MIIFPAPPVRACPVLAVDIMPNDEVDGCLRLQCPRPARSRLFLTETISSPFDSLLYGLPRCPILCLVSWERDPALQDNDMNFFQDICKCRIFILVASRFLICSSKIPSLSLPVLSLSKDFQYRGIAPDTPLPGCIPA